MVKCGCVRIGKLVDDVELRRRRGCGGGGAGVRWGINAVTWVGESGSMHVGCRYVC